MADGDRELQPSERDAWDSVAEGWRRWFPAFEAGAQSLNEHLVELARVRPGQRVLDVATGIGEPALTAARRVGAAGSVLATDLSPRMLALGRERAAAAGIAHVEFAERDAEELDLPEASVDAALCRWGLMLMRRPELAARHVHTALRRGGRFAAAVWRTADEVPFLSLARRAALRLLDVPAPDPDAPGPFRLADPDRLRAVLASVGFTAIAVESYEVTLSFASPGDYARFVSDLSSTVRSWLEPLAAHERARVLAAIAAETGAHARADGRVELCNRLLCCVGTKA